MKIYKSCLIKVFFSLCLLFPLLTQAENNDFRYSAVSKYLHPEFKNVTVTPLASNGGRITPNVIQVVLEGSSLLFTATADAGYEIADWFLDDKLVQTGGKQFSLFNITQDHQLKVTFYKKPGVFFVGVGENRNNKNTPYIVTCKSEGLCENRNVGTFSGDISLKKISCTGNSENVLCVTVGKMSESPFMLISKDKGNSWSQPVIPNLPVKGLFNDVKCVGVGNNATCVAVGENLDYRPLTLIATSHNGGKDWALETNQVVNDEGLKAVSCTNEAYPICTAVGGSDSLYLPPIILVSTDSGKTWLNDTPKDLPTDLILNKVICSGKGDKASCNAIGQNGITIFLHSNDGAKSWQKVAEYGKGLHSLSCTGSGLNGYCVMVSESNIVVSVDGGLHWLRDTNNNYNSTQSYNGIWTTYTTTSCFGEGNSAICIIAGYDFPTKYDDYNSFVFGISRNREGSNVATIKETLLDLDHALCLTNDNSSTACIITGAQLKPFIAISLDAGKVWQNPNGNLIEGHIVDISGIIW